MPIIDLRDYIVSAAGTWQNPVLLSQQTPFSFTLADTRGPTRLLLRWAGDSVTLAGPVRIRVTFQVENLTYEMGTWSAKRAAPLPGSESDAGGGLVSVEAGGSTGGPRPSPSVGAGVSLLGAATLQANTVYSYPLDIPAGQVWPFVYEPRTPAREMGANFYDRVLIEVAGFDTIGGPVASADLPCDLGVVDRPDCPAFFPTACEPCDPAAQVRMPPLTPALSVRPADGGCVRTRFFNGMFITQEDLETEQRYFRVKHRLHNRTIGQGVVWGLNVGKQGDQICVLPGFAIDCCGNDLTVTTVYRIDIAALLRDPAAAQACARGAGGQHRMHLLLEFVECPSDLRPVHHDPCGPTGQLCEPSRIRETVRLRLVPPRDPDTSGPLRDFLLTAQKLHDKYGQRLETVTDLPAASAASLVIHTARSRYDVRPDGQTVSFASSDIALNARVTEGVFTGGTLRVVTDDGTAVAETPLALLSFPGATGLPVTLDPALGYRVELAAWRAESPLAPEPGWADTGTAVYTVRRQADRWRVTGRVEEQPARVVPARVPACADPCATPDGRGREPGPCDPPRGPIASLRWPWLHGDPLAEIHAGDPKAIVLGVLGAWLRHAVASSADAGTPQGWSFQRVASAVVYRAVWLMFYGVDAGRERQDVEASVEALLRGWCRAALYPGPVCGCEPHGVVIGCTTVKAGTLGDVDPFGGRRYVIQYPLLAYWGSQIGIVPPDASIARLFSLLCCIGALPRPTTTPGSPAVLFKLAEAQGETPAGAGTRQTIYLAIGTEKGIAAAYENETGRLLEVGAVHKVGFLLFASYVIEGLRGQLPPSTLPVAGGAAPQRIVERYTLGGLLEPGVVSLLVTRGGEVPG
jgi:hypothetical protein